MQRLRDFYQAKRASVRDDQPRTSSLAYISVGTAPLLVILALLLAITMLSLVFSQDAHADQVTADVQAAQTTREAPQMYTVTFKNVIDGTQTKQYQYAAGARVQFNAGSYEGHTFKCWRVAEGNIPDFSESAQNAVITSFTMLSENITLVAEWSEIQYIDAEFNFNGSVGNNISPKDPQYIKDETTKDGIVYAQLAVGKTININAGTKEGYIFDHWTVDSGSPNVIFANKNTASTSFTVLDKNVRIVALWKKTYKVTVEGSYAKENSGAGSYSENTNVRINAGTNPDSTMRFDGWTVKCDKEIKFTPDADSAVAYFMMPGANVTLTAKWTKMGTVSNKTDTESNFMGADLVGTGTEIANKVFKTTSNEMTEINKGSDASFRLTAKQLAASAVSATDKSLVKTAMGSNLLAYYMDISLYAKIGSSAEKRITDTAQRVTIRLSLAKGELVAPTGYKRTFKIIALHGSTASLLTPTYTYDPKTGTATLTFTTDQFSTYALVYTDTPDSSSDDTDYDVNDPTNQVSSGLNSGSGNGGTGSGLSSSDTGDHGSNTPVFALIMIAFAALAALVRRVRKQAC